MVKAFFNRGTFRALLAGGVVLGATAAFADPMGISNPIIRVTASNAAGSGSFTATTADLQEFPPGSGSYRFLQLAPIVITDTGSGAPVATLIQATLFLDPDPQIGLGFAVQAGSSNTTFTITSSTLTASISPAVGEASAALTLTDVNGNGGTLSGNFAAGNSYSAQYNGAFPAATTFAAGVPVLTAPGSVADSFNVTSTPIGVPVTDMTAGFSFTVTANDLASGTSNYKITPEPASLLLLALGALSLRRR